MVEAAHASDEEVQDQSFLEVPAILDKFKAAAQIADGKQSLANDSRFTFTVLISRSGNWSGLILECLTDLYF
jgi:hypothetical protein